MKRNCLLIAGVLISNILFAQARIVTDFNKGWKFYLGNDAAAAKPLYNDSRWRVLQLPHDWSIEGSFSENHPTTFNEGALPAGVGWYRKTFLIPATSNDKRIFINFDGIYKNSEVWINGHYLGKRPNGYISFRYELTKYLNFGATQNVIAVKADNSAQPDSRWYTGSGIYRKAWLLTTNKIAVDQWGTFVSTPVIDKNYAAVKVETVLTNSIGKPQKINIENTITNAEGTIVADQVTVGVLLSDSITSMTDKILLKEPVLWSVDHPYLYSVKTVIRSGNTILDEYDTPLGIRYFNFDAAKGFFLNGKALKILGVCNHHDLGALGAAVNKRAIERQLEILKAMGVNAIRTAHNLPATELLDLCDRMGFIVMDEAFDMWEKKKNRQDYHLDFEKWHAKDLQDQVKRDRNHPSVFMWSIGNEIREQFDSTGITITNDLVRIIKQLDTTRPVTSALTENIPSKNFIYQSGALDLLGFNYKLYDYKELPGRFPNQKFIAAETSSALATRGWYDMPSDSVRLWPPNGKTPAIKGIENNTVSAYDHVYAYWGSSHEAGWNAVKKYDFMSGLFVWSGFDFLGEPVPYHWPSRSSYYGVIDLAGFPKDVYYMYQSEWTNKRVLHLFPHWNWAPGKVVDVWAYYNNADEVELFLNDKSMGVQKKPGEQLHVMWRVNYEPGTLRAISRKNGKQVLKTEVKTAGKPAKIRLVADRKVIQANGEDLSFITVQILDANGNLVPAADNLVTFKINGNGLIAGVDNGSQTSMEPFKASYRKAFNGMCLAIIQSKEKAGNIVLEASSKGLQTESIMIESK